MTIDALGTVRRRLVEQGLAGDPFAHVTSAVSWLGAVQAQEFAEVKWSLAERTGAPTDLDVEAVFDRGDIVRTHLLRPTWHAVAAADLRWLLRLSRPRVHAVNRHMDRRLELTPDVLQRSDAVIATALQNEPPMTRPELAARLAAAGIAADGMRLAYLVMHAELEAVVCSGPRRGKQHTYALVDDRVPPSPLDDLDGDAALAELVRRYFRSHGPATIKDFVAWSSLTVSATRRGIDLAGDALARVDDGTGTPWFAAPIARRPVPTTTGQAWLVPMYDETIVAYQDLRVVLADAPAAPALTLERAVVVDGHTVGSWRRTLTARAVTVEVTAFAAPSALQRKAIEAAVDRFGQFLGRPAELVVRVTA